MPPLFDALITSKMRVRILMRLFLDPKRQAYLRELASEFGASPGHVNKELQQLAEAGLLASEHHGRQINYKANTGHPLFPELQSMVRKSLGMDQVLESIVMRLGKLEAAYLIGDYALGRDTGVVDLLLVGAINRANLTDLSKKTERYINRKIRSLVLTPKEFESMADSEEVNPRVELWRAKDKVQSGP